MKIQCIGRPAVNGIPGQGVGCIKQVATIRSPISASAASRILQDHFQNHQNHLSAISISLSVNSSMISTMASLKAFLMTSLSFIFDTIPFAGRKSISKESGCSGRHWRYYAQSKDRQQSVHILIFHKNSISLSCL